MGLKMGTNRLLRHVCSIVFAEIDGWQVVPLGIVIGLCVVIGSVILIRAAAVLQHGGLVDFL